MPSKRPKPSKLQESLAVYSDPHVYRMAECASTLLGRGPDHPRFGRDLTMFFLDLEPRIYGNRLECHRENRTGDTWQRKRRAVKRMTGRDLLLPLPPKESLVRRWRSSLVPVPENPRAKARAGYYEDLPAKLQALEMLARELGAARARELGHFPTGVAKDFLQPHRRHSVALDGSYLSPFSFARVWTDPDGVEHRVGSRAKSNKSVRQQAIVNGETKNQHKYMGVNHVVAITATKYGRVVLGTTRALHGEPIAAVDLLESCLTHLGDGLHAVLYDKGLQQWAQEYLLRVHGILPVVPPDRHRSSDDEVEALRLDAAATIRAALPPPKGKAKKSKTGPDRRPVAKELSKAMADHQMGQKYDAERLHKRFKKGLAIGAGLPVGQSQFLNSQKKVVQSRTRHHQHTDYVHDLPGGRECRHLLQVDDSALWEVEPSNLGLVKQQRVAVASAYPDGTPGHYDLVINHELVCRHTGEILPIRSRFAHSSKRGPGGMTGRTAEQLAQAAIRPLAPCEKGFRKPYGKRSEIESWFEFMKQRLLDGKRAASLDINHQFLDVLYVGLISNALALRVYRLEGM